MALTRVKSKNFVHATGTVDFLPPGSEDRRFHVVEEKPAKERTGARIVIAKDGMFVTLGRRPTVDRAWVVWVSDGGMMIEMEVVEKGQDREKVLADMAAKHGGAK
jgi:hypothetical protein